MFERGAHGVVVRIGIRISDIQALDNGDVSGEMFVHYCIQGGAVPCCVSADESVGKLLKAYKAHFGFGFESPLLYRFKHAGQAQLWMQDFDVSMRW